MSTQRQQAETETQSAETDAETAKDRRLDEKRKRAEERERERVEEAERTAADAERYHLKVFRYDPEVEGKQEPRFDDFHVPYEKGMTVLDALIYARDTFDSSLTFRHSCRQAICGSDALFVNGR